MGEILEELTVMSNKLGGGLNSLFFLARETMGWTWAEPKSKRE